MRSHARKKILCKFQTAKWDDDFDNICDFQGR
uniref:Uncharacterized protein n=1 Tax=Anguilla anguilla TaxID=7936 RepID=A0A0E9SWP9_ANGAN